MPTTNVIQQPAMMAVPAHGCQQQPNIDNIAKTLDRMEDGQKNIVRLLEKVAGQDARIETLETNSNRDHKSINSLLDRMRDVELKDAAGGPESTLRLHTVIKEFSDKIDAINGKMEKMLDFYKLITGQYAKYIYLVLLGMLFFSFAVGLKDHYSWLETMWRLWVTGSIR